MAGQMCGGIGEVKQATAETQQLVDSVGFMFNFDASSKL
jgi:hypothetical protein